MPSKVAQAANYTNAGTVEFLVDPQKNFYFLEMNTRLQVEHPVTELTTGLDLVHLQIRIAAGETLPFRQSDVEMRGHAIECRIYAEDPDNNYFPSPGKITLLLEPSGPGIRRDSGMYEGWNVPVDYDPLLAKLIGYGTDREQAIMRLQRALGEYFVAGIKTNISLFQRILCDADFRRENSIPDTWIACSRKATRTSRRAHRSPAPSRSDAGSDRGDCRRNVCRARPGFARQQEWGHRSHGLWPGFGSIQLETEGTLGSAALISMVYEVIVSIGAVASHTGWSLKKPPADGSAAWTGNRSS